MMKRHLSKRWVIVSALAAAVLAVGAVATPAAAVTPTDPDAAMTAWNSAFWVANGSGGNLYRWSNHTTNADWTSGSDLSTLVDEFERTGSSGYLTQIGQEYNFLTSSSGWGAEANWCANISSGSFTFDDALWAVLALIRANKITGTSTFLTAAQSSWDCLYAAGWKSTPGVLTYHLNDHFAAANDTFGGIVAAYELYDITGDSKYATEATNLLSWSVDSGNLFDSSTGEVYNAKDYDATKSFHGGTSQIDYNDWTYNYGIFVGAMTQAYRHTTGTTRSTYLADGLAALQHVFTYNASNPSSPVSSAATSNTDNAYNMIQASGVLTDEVLDKNSAEFKRDLIEYATQFLNATDSTSSVGAVFGKYIALLQVNANIAWTNRNPSNLMGQTSSTLTDPHFGIRLTTSAFDSPASTGVNLASSAALPGVQAMVSVPSDGTNVAPLATVAASSVYSSAYAASKAVDNIVGQNKTGEWASNGELNPSITLTWSTAQRLDKVVLFDRPNTVDNANSGTLSFSDGSSLPVTGLSQTGQALSIPFTPRNVTWAKFTVTGGAGSNVGLSEFQAYAENDLAAGKTATASSTYPGTSPSYAPANAVDSDPGTRFSSDSAGTNNWFQVDLGSTQSVSTVETDWENAYGKDYTIQLSTDGVTYTTVAQRSAANQNEPFEGGPTVDTFPPTQARYVKLVVTAGYRATNWNFSFWAFKAFGYPS